MRKGLLLISLAIGMTGSSCDGNRPVEKEVFAADSCRLELGNVQFVQLLNVESGTVSVTGDTLCIKAGENTDFFCDPQNVSTRTSSPVLLAAVDNTRPFTFTAKVEPQFTVGGTYSAGVVFVFADKNHWQKLCYEQDEAGDHRIVTVRTVGTSDDNNHQRMNARSVHLRISSDTRVIGSYYSEDGERWYMVRLYKNEYPSDLYVCLSAQSPRDKAHTCLFSDVSLVERSVADFRKGSL